MSLISRKLGVEGACYVPTRGGNGEVTLMRGLVLGLGLCLLAIGPAAAQSTTAAASRPASAGSQAPDLGQLHERLRLTPNQESAWRDYAGAVTANAQPDARRRAAAELLPTLTTPRRIALMEAALAADAGDLRRTGQAVIAFYMQLTPEQQRTFDRETLPPSGQTSDAR